MIRLELEKNHGLLSHDLWRLHNYYNLALPLQQSFSFKFQPFCAPIK